MSYVLTSLLPKTARQHLLPSPANPPQHALLLTVLALIHLNLGRLTERMWGFGWGKTGGACLVGLGGCGCFEDGAGFIVRAASYEPHKDDLSSTLPLLSCISISLFMLWILMVPCIVASPSSPTFSSPNSKKKLTEELWRHLEELGVSNGNARHPQLGNVKDAIATMIKQRFVFESKTNSQDGEIRFYEWGEQALAQVNTEEMDQWVHDLCGVQRMTPAPAPQVKAERSRR